jgi:hypothetical protein
MRATSIQQIQRTNLALTLLKRQTPVTAVLSQLMVRYQLSRRQAYRYLRQAAAHPAPLPVPSAKTAFTVKLPVPLVGQLRRQAQQSHQPLSMFVAQALEACLQPGSRHG